MKDAGYPNKTSSARPPIESVAGYSKNREPAGAAFNKGFSDRRGAAEAQDARREHSRELGSRRNSPTK